VRIPALTVLLVFSWAAVAQSPKTLKFDGRRTLEELAEELFADVGAAEELRALNKIPRGGQPAPGAELRLPGPERQAAVQALEMAAQALSRAEAGKEPGSEHLVRAAERLQQARQALRSARYDECRRLADEVWALARLAQHSGAPPAGKSRFAVAVDENGNTTVGVLEGEGVKVVSGKHSAQVAPGEVVRFSPGSAPAAPRKLLDPPRPLLPGDGALVITRSIFFSWQAVAGARRYVLLLSRDAEGLQPVRQLSCQETRYVLRSSLEDGTYFWTLRSVDADGIVGPASPPRRLVLQEAADGGLSLEQEGRP
jgi:hypothetical protein